MRITKLFLAAVGCAAGVAALPASAAVIGITVADASSGNYTLTSVSVSRGGAGVFTYVPTQLTGITLTDVFAVDVPLVTSRGAPLPAMGTRAELIQDMRLDTGVVNPASIGALPDESFEIVFDRPVVNSAGEDILVFDLGSGDSTRFWISGTDRQTQGVTLSSFSSALLSGMPYTSFPYRNNGDVNINDLVELETSPLSAYGTPRDESANIVAGGIDLSAFGIPLGGSVTSLRFQAEAAGARLDPMLIVGLPVIPEPSSLGLIGLAVLSLRRRGRGRAA